MIPNPWKLTLSREPAVGKSATFHFTCDCGAYVELQLGINDKAGDTDRGRCRSCGRVFHMSRVACEVLIEDEDG